jgi:hypothetical protein
LPSFAKDDQLIGHASPRGWRNSKASSVSKARGAAKASRAASARRSSKASSEGLDDHLTAGASWSIGSLIGFTLG